MEELRTFKDMKAKGQLSEAVLICSRKTKFVIQTSLPQYDFDIIGTDLCEDDKLYMVTDKTIAEKIRQNMKYLKMGETEVKADDE